MTNELMDWIVCGRKVGRATGWDQNDTFALMLYGFHPAEEYKGPSGDVLFRFENGTIESFNRDGTVKESCDLIEAIRHLPIERTDTNEAGS